MQVKKLPKNEKDKELIYMKKRKYFECNNIFKLQRSCFFIYNIIYVIKIIK